MLYFCRRGRENLQELKRDSFKIAVDANGCQYVSQVRDELTKNHREEHESVEGGFMYETGEERCPVNSLEKYLSKLNPDCLALFRDQRHIIVQAKAWTVDGMIIR